MSEAKSIPDLVADCTEIGHLAHAHRNAIEQAPGNAGWTAEERERLIQSLAKAEDDLLQAAAALHEASGILLCSSMRWRAREAQGQDPTEEETPH